LELALPKGEVKSRSLAAWLRKNKDRVVGDLCVRSIGSGERGASWRIEKIRSSKAPHSGDSDVIA
jgi:hypothetical protein